MCVSVNAIGFRTAVCESRTKVRSSSLRRVPRESTDPRQVRRTHRPCTNARFLWRLTASTSRRSTAGVPPATSSPFGESQLPGPKGRHRMQNTPSALALSNCVSVSEALVPTSPCASAPSQYDHFDYSTNARTAYCCRPIASCLHDTTRRRARRSLGMRSGALRQGTPASTHRAFAPASSFPYFVATLGRAPNVQAPGCLPDLLPAPMGVPTQPPRLDCSSRLQRRTRHETQAAHSATRYATQQRAHSP